MSLEQVKKIRCKKCGSTLIYRRLITNEVVCRKCGNIEQLYNEKGGLEK